MDLVVPQRGHEDGGAGGLIDDDGSGPSRVGEGIFRVERVGGDGGGEVARSATRTVAREEVDASLGRDHQPTFAADDVDGPGEGTEDVGVERGPRALDAAVDEPVRPAAVCFVVGALEVSLGLARGRRRGGLRAFVPVRVEPVVGEVRRGDVGAVVGEVAGHGPVLDVEFGFRRGIVSPGGVGGSSGRRVVARAPPVGVEVETHLPAGEVCVERVVAVHHEDLGGAERLGHGAHVDDARPVARLRNPFPRRAPPVRQARDHHRKVGTHVPLEELIGGELRGVHRRDRIASRERRHLRRDVRHDAPARERMCS